MKPKEKAEDLVGKWMWKMILNQAKEMKKERIKDAWIELNGNLHLSEETYKKK
jgi:hypothetical protein